MDWLEIILDVGELLGGEEAGVGEGLVGGEHPPQGLLDPAQKKVSV